MTRIVLVTGGTRDWASVLPGISDAPAAPWFWPLVLPRKALAQLQS